jgi:hypothetical protein
MPPIVSKLKGEKCFQLHYTCSERFFAVLLPLALSNFPSPSFGDAAEAQSYSA